MAAVAITTPRRRSLLDRLAVERAMTEVALGARRVLTRASDRDTSTRSRARGPLVVAERPAP